MLTIAALRTKMMNPPSLKLSLPAYIKDSVSKYSQRANIGDIKNINNCNDPFNLQ